MLSCICFILLFPTSNIFSYVYWPCGFFNLMGVNYQKETCPCGQLPACPLPWDRFLITLMLPLQLCQVLALGKGSSTRPPTWGSLPLPSKWHAQDHLGLADALGGTARFTAYLVEDSHFHFSVGFYKFLTVFPA